MDTNVISFEQFKAFVEMQKSLAPVLAPVSTHGFGLSAGVQIALIIVGALGGIFTAVASWIAGRAATGAQHDTMAIKASQVIQEGETKKIHAAVNSRDSTSVAEIKSLNEKNGEMIRLLATLQEKVSALIADRDQTVRVHASPSALTAPAAVAIAAPAPATAPPAPTSGSIATDANTEAIQSLLNEFRKVMYKVAGEPAALRTTTDDAAPDGE